MDDSNEQPELQIVGNADKNILPPNALSHKDYKGVETNLNFMEVVIDVNSRSIRIGKPEFLEKVPKFSKDGEQFVLGSLKRNLEGLMQNEEFFAVWENYMNSVKMLTDTLHSIIIPSKEARDDFKQQSAEFLKILEKAKRPEEENNPV